VARPSPIVRYGRYGAVAYEFSGTIGAGVLVGWLLDKWLGTPPWALVTCTLLAVVGGFLRLVLTLRSFERVDLGREP